MALTNTFLRSEVRAHIGGKRFFQESLKAEYWASELFFFLWRQKPPISNSQESAWPQRYHFQLFTKYISQNFSHGFSGYSQLFFFQYPTQKIHTDLLQEMFFPKFSKILMSFSQECAKPQPHFLEALSKFIFTNIFQIFPSNVQYIQFSRPKCCHFLPCTKDILSISFFRRFC